MDEEKKHGMNFVNKGYVLFAKKEADKVDEGLPCKT